MDTKPEESTRSSVDGASEGLTPSELAEQERVEAQAEADERLAEEEKQAEAAEKAEAAAFAADKPSVGIHEQQVTEPAAKSKQSKPSSE